VIDGRNIWPLFAGDRNGRTPHEAFFYYQFEQLQAVRAGPWKLFVPLERQRLGSGAPLKIVNSPARLYHVVDDQTETRDIAASNPDVVARLLKLADRGKREIGDLDLPGRGERPAGWVFQPQTQQLPAQR
jgi:arylsulfatase A-like enzyme